MSTGGSCSCSRRRCDDRAFPGAGHASGDGETLQGVSPGDRRIVQSNRSLQDVRSGNGPVCPGTLLRRAEPAAPQGARRLLQDGTTRQWLLSDWRGLGSGDIEDRADRSGGGVGEKRAIVSLLEERTAVRVAGLLSLRHRRVDQQSGLFRRYDRLWTRDRAAMSRVSQHVVQAARGSSRGKILERV